MSFLLPSRGLIGDASILLAVILQSRIGRDFEDVDMSRSNVEAVALRP